MSFIGIVTRKEQDTGVTLEAKIVTPNKKKATRQRFKVKVKKTGLTDYECCVIDQATIRNKLNKQQDLTAIKNDINFTYNGENGTTVEYKIENIGSPEITQYIGDDGKIISRPLYGDSDANGYIVMTVKKGKESLSTKIRIAIKQNVAQEVLNNIAITEKALWNSICGKNAQWNSSESSSGHKNIFYDLNLISSSNDLLPEYKNIINSLTKTPISIKWTITDNARNSVITEDRINESGKIFTPSYKDACTLINSNTKANVVSTGRYTKRIRIDDLILKATLTLGTESKQITFDCSTCSKYITNEEVINFAQSKTDIIINEGLNRLSYKDISSSSSETIKIPASAAGAQFYFGLACQKTADESYEIINELQLNIGEVDYTFTHRILEFKNAEKVYEDTDGIFSNTIIGNTTVVDKEHFGSSTRWPLTVDVDKLKALSSSSKKFTIETIVTASRYSKDGTSESATGEVSTKLYCHIVLDDSAVISSTSA